MRNSSWKEELIDVVNFTVVLAEETATATPKIQQLLPWSVSSHQHRAKSLQQQKDWLAEISDDD